MSGTRNDFRKIIKSFYTAIHTLGLRIAQNVGFHSCPTGMTVSETSLLRQDQKNTQLYEQGATKKSAGMYLRLWLGWAGIWDITDGNGLGSEMRPLAGWSGRSVAKLTGVITVAAGTWIGIMVGCQTAGSEEMGTPTPHELGAVDGPPQEPTIKDVFPGARSGDECMNAAKAWCEKRKGKWERTRDLLGIYFGATCADPGHAHSMCMFETHTDRGQIWCTGAQAGRTPWCDEKGRTGKDFCDCGESSRFDIKRLPPLAVQRDCLSDAMDPRHNKSGQDRLNAINSCASEWGTAEGADRTIRGQDRFEITCANQNTYIVGIYGGLATYMRSERTDTYSSYITNVTSIEDAAQSICKY